MTNNTSLEKVRNALSRLRENILKVDSLDNEKWIHRSVCHSGHDKCIFIGLNATSEDMRTLGYRGSYFLMGDDGKIYEQNFIQSIEEPLLENYREVSEEDFLTKISSLPKENIANPDTVVEVIEARLEKLAAGR